MSIIYNLIDELHNGFHYDPVQGRLLKIEEIAITQEDSDGKYRSKRSLFDGQHRLRTHIVFFIMTGRWPKELVDHKNGDSSNNTWDNLREATYQENSYNRRSRRSSSTLEMGVQPAPYGKYRVKINGIHIGNYSSIEEANAASRRVRQRLYKEFDYNNRPEAT